MVDLLCEQGDQAGADALEELWNAIAGQRDFSLLCGYRVDLFDHDAQLRLLPQVYRAHTRVLPAVDPKRLEDAVDHALVAVLGASDAKKVHAQILRHARDEYLSTAHLALLWISAHMPRTAKRVLAEAQSRYLADATTA
jgi:hypothetical protein